MDEITPVMPINRITPEEKHYLQLTALAQLGGVLNDSTFIPCPSPAVVINQSGTTEATGTNWLLPVAEKDCYSHFYNDAINVNAYEANTESRKLSEAVLPQRTRL